MAKVKKYRVTADSRQFVLNEVARLGRDSKTPGAQVLRPVGYYTNLQALCMAMGDHMLRDACPDEGWAPGELLSAIEGVRASVRALVCEEVPR